MYIFIPTPTAHFRQNPDESELQSVCVSKGISWRLIERITFLSSGTATTLMPFFSP